MGEIVKLTAADGHHLNAYKAGPANAAHGLVVIQEIFGCNIHIRNMVDRFAKRGTWRSRQPCSTARRRGSSWAIPPMTWCWAVMRA